MKNKSKLFLLVGFISSILIVIFLKLTFLKENKKTVNNNKKIENFYLVNVLEKEDFDDSNIYGSINIPFEEADLFLKSIENKNVTIVFYCSNYMCTASHIIAANFIKKGFKNIYVYSGGTAEWYQKGLSDKNFKINGPCLLPYLKIVIPKPNNHSEFPFIQAEDKIKNKIKKEPINLEAEELLKMLIENNIL